MKKITTTILFAIFFIMHSSVHAMDIFKQIISIIISMNMDADSKHIAKCLFYAAQQGDLARVRKSLDAGADINYQNAACGNETPLIAAAKNNHPEIVDLLLKQGANTTLQSNFITKDYRRQYTALFHAIYQGYTLVVQTILDNAPETIHSCDSNHSTPLILATDRGYLDIVKLLIARGDNPRARNNIHDKDGYNFQNIALEYAVEKGYLDIAKCLLEADPNTVDMVDPEYGITPLMKAAYARHLEMVQLLLAYGANPKLRNWGPKKDGSIKQWTALCYAALKKNALITAELAAKVTLDTQDRCPACWEAVGKITPGQLRITACCMKPVCYNCAQAIRTSASGDQCPLCRTQPLLTVMPPEQEPERPCTCMFKQRY